MQPIIKNAGKDISQWFEPRTFNMDEEIGVEVLLWRHPTMKLSTYYTPQVHAWELSILLILQTMWVNLFTKGWTKNETALTEVPVRGDE